jgi:hypothetical protein
LSCSALTPRLSPLFWRCMVVVEEARRHGQCDSLSALGQVFHAIVLLHHGQRRLLPRRYRRVTSLRVAVDVVSLLSYLWACLVPCGFLRDYSGKLAPKPDPSNGRFLPACKVNDRLCFPPFPPSEGLLSKASHCRVLAGVSLRSVPPYCTIQSLLALAADGLSPPFSSRCSVGK